MAGVPVLALRRSPRTCSKSDDWGRRGGSLQLVRTRGSFICVYGLISSVDPILLVLGLTQTIFEGSMYLFVFIWVPTLQESSLSPSSLPLGYIFSAFMVSMMLGSLLYTFITAHWYSPSTSTGLQKHARSASVGSVSSPGDSSLVLHAQLSSLVCAASAVTFAACVRVGKGRGEEGEHLKFWAFCLFEACVGMYYPVQGMLRGSFISNEHRATVSSLFFGQMKGY
jgi:MFS transporter, MFS domain-containing protein family, molybdate-anion transporter